MTIAAPPIEAPARTATFRAFFKAMARSKIGLVGLIGVLLLVLASIIGPLVTDAPTTHVGSIYATPNWAHPLGTDSEGRDILVRMLRGGRPVLFVGFLAAMISTLVAITFGSLAAYVGGRVDTIIVTITDIVLTVPQIVLLAVLSAMYRLDNMFVLALIVGLLGWPTLLRAVRAQVLSLKEREYVEAARLLDLGTPHILFREILPNMGSFILMNFTIGMTHAIYSLVGLYFLGLAPLAGENWGIMLNEAEVRGAIYSQNSVFYIMVPIAAISLLQLALVSMTRSLEEILNPRLRDD